MRSPPLALVPALLVLPACFPSGNERPLTEPGISWTLAEHRSRTISELRYEYELSIPASRTDPVAGSLTARFRWEDADRRDVVLDFTEAESRVSRVAANGVEIPLRVAADHVVIPARSLSPGEENSVQLDFTAGDQSLNRRDSYLYTLFVPDRAHTSLPIFDQPNLKARFTLTLEVPPGWKALTNSPLRGGGGPAGEGEGNGGTVGGRPTFRFAESDPLPPYLFAFAAGEFEVIRLEREGRVLEMFHRETDSAKVARNTDAIFDLHIAALDWLEEYTGIPYPFQKVAFVLVPSFQYGGMEHPGAVTYRASSLLLDESATQGQVLGRASLIAHETAHIWFGDLVTMNWFDDVWTKEVFANFMAAKIVHPSFPELDHDLRFLLAHHPSAYEVDRSRGANPIRQDLDNLREAGSLYGAIIYQKAPVVMKLLERIVGEEAFRDGLREYLETYRWGNARWPDLVAILDRRSQEDLVAWSQVWVEEAGRPTISTEIVPYGRDGIARLTFKQADPEGKGRIWPQPFVALLGYGDGGVEVPVPLMASEADVDAADRALPDFILPNAAGLGYGLFTLDEKSQDALVARLPRLPDPLWRGAGWITLEDAVLEGRLAPERWLELLLRGAREEKDEQNVQRVLRYLTDAWWRLTLPEARAREASRVEETLWGGLRQAGSSTLKASYFRAYQDVVTTPSGLARLRSIWGEDESVPGLVLSEVDYTTMALELAVREVPGWPVILERQEARITNPDRRARFNFLRPSVAADPARRTEFFESLRDPASREEETWVTAGLAYLNHPLRAPGSERFILPALEMVEEIQRTGDIFFPKAWVDATLSGHSSATAAGIVEAFLEGRPDYPDRLRGKILQSADYLFRAARILQGGP